MIRTDRQYRAATQRKDELMSALDDLGPSLEGDRDLDWTSKALQSSLIAQVTDLDAELVEYEQLLAGAGAQLAEITSLDELPRMLIQARIAAGITQRELARRLGVREQQIQRYEAEEYGGAGLGRIRDVMAALGIGLNAEVAFPPPETRAGDLERRLGDLGLPRRVAVRRLLRSSPSSHGEANGTFLQGAIRAARVFGSSVEELLSGDLSPMTPAGAFRAIPNANVSYLDAYATYAHYIASLLARASVVERRPITTDPASLRAALGEQVRVAPLSALVSYCWAHGVPVLPLADEAAFHGACWEIEGGPVIVLKQRTPSLARWAFLLAHELKHASDPVHSRVVLEGDESLRDWKESPAEIEADRFAGEVLLGERAEAMARVAAEAAEGNVARLKSVIPEVAEAGGVAPDVLAYFMAHRLVLNGISWWGTARSFDPVGADAWSVARSAAFENIDLSRLDEIDRGLLVDALAP